MSRSILAPSPEQRTSCDLDACIAHAEALNEQNRQTFTTPFPKASSRWLSHYECTPHPLALTSQGDVLTRELGLELPLGNPTEAADANEGHVCIAHRQALPLPVTPGQVHLGDAANDVTATYRWIHDQGGIAICDSTRRNEHLDPESLRKRGYDPHGTP